MTFPASRSPLRLAAATAAATGVVALAAAGPASAAYEYYGVEVDAVVDTSYVGQASTPTFEHDSSVATSTRVTSAFLAVIERDAGGRIIGANGEDQHEATTTGTITAREREFHAGSGDWYERGSACVGAGRNRNDEGRTILESDPLTPLVGGALRLTLADRLLVALTCETTGRHGGAGPGSFTLKSPRPDDPFSQPAGPLAVDFALPPEATAAGKVIQLFEGPAAGQEAYCPEDLAESAHRKSCRVTFRGTITLTKTDLGGQPPAPGGQDGAGPGTPAPPAPPVLPGPTVPPPSSPRPASTSTPPATPRIPAGQRAVLGTGGSHLTFRATCPTACTGTASIRVPVGGKGRAKRTRTLATVPVTLAAGARARTVRVAIPGKARHALRRTPGAAVVVALRPTGGRKATVTLQVRR